MLVHKGKILAIGPAKTDTVSLSGNGTSASPLGVKNFNDLATSAWVDQNFARTAPSGDYATKPWVNENYYSKTVSDQRFQPKGNYQPAGDYMTNAQFNTRTQNWDVTPYSGDGQKIDVDSNHKIKIIGTWFATPEELQALSNTLAENYYTKEEVEHLISQLGGYKLATYNPQTQKPETDVPVAERGKYIFLTKESDSRKDNYSEWIWLSNDWVCIGTTSLELEDYVTEDEWNARIPEYAKQSWVSANYQPKGDYLSANALDDYYNKTTIDQKIENFITSAEADERYQLKGDYATKQELTDKAEEISAWANGKFITSAALEPYAKTVDVNEQFRLTSAWANDTFLTEQSIEPFKTASADWNEAYRLVSNFSGNWNEVSAKLDKTDFNAYSADIASALDNRYTKDQTSASDQLSEEFAKYAKTEDLEGLASEEWVEQNFISSAASANWDLQGYSGAGDIKIENHIVSFTGDYVDPTELETALEPYMFTSAAPIVKSTNGSVLVSAYMENGHQIYDLSATSGAGDITQISAEKGLSAEKDDDGVWHIGVTDYQVSFGRFRLDPYETDFDAIEEPVGDAIIFSADGSNINHVVLKEGIYHIDAQVDVNVGEITSQELGFYPVSVSANIAPWATVTRDVDNSYAHTDTIEVSFDAFIKNETELKINVSNVPGNATRYVRNLNITEQISVDAILQGGGSNYTAGDAIGIDPGTNAINVRPGGGLKIDRSDNTLTINCGNGLKINEESLEATLELDEVTEAVVNQVNKIADDLETKVTCDFDYANITDRTDYTQYGSTLAHGVLLGFLFAAPINSKIYAENESEEYETKIAVIASQSYTQKPIILGLFEYDPNYWDETEQQRGRTTALCDTGPVQLTAGGLNEFVVKNIGNKHIGPNGENLASLKSGCMYYAAIYISENPGTGLFLASCPKYNVNFNTKPTLTTDQCNISIDTGNASQASRCNFNEITFKSGTLANFHELPEVPRMFMQVRNAKKTTVN